MQIDTIRVWKDAHYYQSLTAEQKNLLPENPVGDFELTDIELEAASGGMQNQSLAGCQFTGGDGGQCPTFGNPNGSCETSHNANGIFSLIQITGVSIPTS